MSDFVEADEGENVAVDVAEASRDAAPDGGFLAEKGRFDRRADAAGFGIKLYPAEARSVIEADAAEGPLFVFRDDIFGDEDDLRGTADELVLDRIWLGGNEGKNGGAVGRSDGDEAFPGLKLNVVGEVEAELVEVEAEAAVEIADEDLSGMDTEVWGGRRRGWCAGGHDGDYTAGRRTEEKDNAEAQRCVRKYGGRFQKKKILAARGMTDSVTGGSGYATYWELTAVPMGFGQPTLASSASGCNRILTVLSSPGLSRTT